MTKELAGLWVDPQPDELLALAVAVYLEDALDIVLPPDVLDADHLGSPAAVEATLDLVLGDA